MSARFYRCASSFGTIAERVEDWATCLDEAKALGPDVLAVDWELVARVVPPSTVDLVDALFVVALARTLGSWLTRCASSAEEAQPCSVTGGAL